MRRPMTSFGTGLLKYALRLSAGLACVAIVLLTAHAKPTAAREAPVAASHLNAAVPLTEVSARRRHRTPRTAVTATAPRPMWGGADPTKGPGIESVREMQRSGRCVFDEGYGRWTACSNM